MPLTIWSTRRLIEKKAWMAARAPPQAAAIRIASCQLPVTSAPQAPKKAPVSIIPSRPMLTTPDRSERMPPIAAKASGVANRRVAASRPVLSTASSESVSRVCTHSAPARQATEATSAHQPSRRSSRDTAHTPAIAPITASTAGSAGERT